MILKKTLTSLLLFVACHAYADTIDDIIHDEMRKRHIPGLSLAIVDGGKIVKVQGYGVTEKGGKMAVTPTTLFQAASVSKPVSALGTLVLVEQGKLNLDEDVNQKLSSWKIPENSFTEKQKVTLRRIMSHSAGLSVHGFGGYSRGDSIPNPVQILNGEKPANSRPVQVMFEPGTKLQYSGGGTTVMQQLLMDVTARPFDQFMQATVLTPLGMSRSSFSQPLNPENLALAASAHDSSRTKIIGAHHLYPEMAAAGLWTTPTDLAKFAMAIQDAYMGKDKAIISKKLAQEMLRPQLAEAGLGFFIKDDGKMQEFSHGGRNEGFDTNFSATFATGQAVIIMINTNDNSAARFRIMQAIAQEYKWPGYALAVKPTATMKMEARQLNAYTGYYDDGKGALLELVLDKAQLAIFSDGFVDDILQPTDKLNFTSATADVHAGFSTDSSGAMTQVKTRMRGEEGRGIKISPLLREITPGKDSKLPRTRQVEEALSELLKTGAKNSKSSWIADGTKNVFVRPMSELKNFSSLQFLTETALEKFDITRHKSKAKTLLAYKLNAGMQAPFIFVFLNAEDQLIDFDLVTN